MGSVGKAPLGRRQFLRALDRLWLEQDKARASLADIRRPAATPAE